jgi:hypothetical protein
MMGQFVWCQQQVEIVFKAVTRGKRSERAWYTVQKLSRTLLGGIVLGVARVATLYEAGFVLESALGVVYRENWR